MNAQRLLIGTAALLPLPAQVGLRLRLSFATAVDQAIDTAVIVAFAECQAQPRGPVQGQVMPGQPALDLRASAAAR